MGSARHGQDDAGPGHREQHAEPLCDHLCDSGRQGRTAAMVEEALERRRLHNERTILFVDEVHRWNKAQQDALLPHIENGTVTFIGATTENPFFEVIGAVDLPVEGLSAAEPEPGRDRRLIDRALTGHRTRLWGQADPAGTRRTGAPGGRGERRRSERAECARTGGGIDAAGRGWQDPCHSAT